MVSSESGGGLVDTRIGSIVWVRRRNGSWWPGKILGADELSASHLMSPRSGTPVKLLGREDASVDWYNLEKSKRVKTFRCGEFDDCIERAEATLGVRSKKREKYARREDAILHALELEKELLEKKYGKVGANSSIRINSCGFAGNDLPTSLGALRNGNGRHESMESQQFPKKVVLPGEDECNSNPLYTQNGHGGAWQSSVKSESNPSVGGSQDFTLPKKIVSAAASDDQAQAFCAAGMYLGSCGDVDSGNSTDKGKGLLDRSIEESSIKRRDRRRPLAQVLQNSTLWPEHSLQPEGDTFSVSVVNNLGEDAQVKRRRLSYLRSEFTDILDIKEDPCSQMENLASNQGVVTHSHADAFAKDAILESSEDTESDSDSSETDSVEHYTNVEMITYSDVNTPMALQSTALTSSEMRGEHASTSGEESDESFPHGTPHLHQKNPVPLDLGVSRWQMKGKRNVRRFSRRSLDKLTYGTYLEQSSLAQRQSRNLSYYHNHDGYSNEVDFIEDGPEPHIEGYGSRGHMLKPQAASRRSNLADSNMVDWEELKWRESSFRGYCGDGFGGFNSLYGGGLHGQELLLDVDVKVQANHRREHVPFVSLMSRLNGKPIIGHPIQIETLGDGSTDDLLSSIDSLENFESDGGDRVPPIWTRARRTANFRVPRPHLSSQLEDVDNQQVYQVRKSVSGNTSGKKKNSGRRKPPKRSSSSSCQKTRPLSSLGMDHKLVSQGLNRYMDGVMKPLDSGPPTVACIPVKLVFSRLLEAIGRPPSSHKGFCEEK